MSASVPNGAVWFKYTLAPSLCLLKLSSRGRTSLSQHIYLFLLEVLHVKDVCVKSIPCFEGWLLCSYVKYYYYLLNIQSEVMWPLRGFKINHFLTYCKFIWIFKNLNLYSFCLFGVVLLVSRRIHLDYWLSPFPLFQLQMLIALSLTKPDVSDLLTLSSAKSMFKNQSNSKRNLIMFK